MLNPKKMPETNLLDEATTISRTVKTSNALPN
jgi:hypothetical protein